MSTFRLARVAFPSSQNRKFVILRGAYLLTKRIDTRENPCTSGAHYANADQPGRSTIHLARLKGTSLDSGDTLILKNSHYHATILSLRIIRFTCFHLPALAHRAGSQHSRKRDMALLL